MNDWDGYGLRTAGGLSAFDRVERPPGPLGDFIAGYEELTAGPVVGITTDGTRHPVPLPAGGVETGPIVEAANRLLEVLRPDERDRLCLPLDAAEKRQWLNVHPNILRHGLLLADLGQQGRRAALAVMEATLSARGYQQARDIMRLNGLLVELTGHDVDFGEWPYFFSLFGSPSADGPWAWQIDGHHLNLNCLVAGDRLVLTPSFMGSEPCRVASGSLAGTEVLVDEERSGLDLIRSLDDGQLATAVLRPSIRPDDLPPELQHPIDGRMVAGAFKDDAVIGYEGIRGDALTDGQRSLLERVIAAYVGWGRDDQAHIRMSEVSAMLDETHFAWMGGRADDDPFYYRIHSPLVLIEFDHHPGIVWDNKMPSRNHIHSVMRTPNGGDYGADVLAEHYERFDHSTGEHRSPSDHGHHHGDPHSHGHG